MSCNHAYEVWQWMVKNGIYPLITATQADGETIGKAFNEVK
jgi:spore coat protein CotF